MQTKNYRLYFAFYRGLKSAHIHFSCQLFVSFSMDSERAFGHAHALRALLADIATGSGAAIELILERKTPPFSRLPTYRNL